MRSAADDNGKGAVRDDNVTREEIHDRRERRYRRIWGMFMQLPVRLIALREGVSPVRIRQILECQARVVRGGAAQTIVGEGWVATSNNTFPPHWKIKACGGG